MNERLLGKCYGKPMLAIMTAAEGRERLARDSLTSVDV